MIIDTNYVSLSEIDKNIRQYYSEDARERIIGYTEGDDSHPITENYTVIVLNQPDEVPYYYVDLRRGERKPWGTIVKSELERAMAWEDFDIKHNQYLMWKDEYKVWEDSKPTEEVWDELLQELVEKPVPAPIKPTVDLSVRRDHYELVEVNEYSTSFTDVYDDNKLELTRTYDVDINKVAERNLSLAIDTKHKLIYAPISFTTEGNESIVIDTGRGRDGILGIDNIKDAFIHYTVTPSLTDIKWITSDNSVHTVTMQDFTNILNIFNSRKQDIITAYTKWREGDLQTPFSI